MSAVAAATIGSAVIGGVIASKSASKAGKRQSQAAEAAATEERAARDELTRLLSPYTAAGVPALQAQMNLLGLGTGSTNWEAYAQSNPAIMQAYEAQKTAPSGFNFGGFGQYGGMQGGQIGGTQSLAEFAQNYYQTIGQGAGDDISAFTLTPEQLQQQAVSGFEANPLFQALARQGEEGILQNASATGGLRGGNVQGALAQFRPSLLNQFIEQQYGRLGNMAMLGQNSAARVGMSGQNAATQIGNRLTEAGQARANSALAQGAAFNTALGSITNFGTSAEGQAAIKGLFS
jgi:hypothetical protein